MKRIRESEKTRPGNLRGICEEAMRLGITMDLSDCLYGDTTGPSSFLNRPTNYYYFLAGFVKTLGLSTILEIGTNYGGSIMAMEKGVRREEIQKSRIVTVDLLKKNKEGFKKYPHIERIQGDSLDREIIQKVKWSFDGEIDLVYLDSLHEYAHTKDNIRIYAGGLNPKYLILDDIRQCDQMRMLWDELSREFKEAAFDASETVIRKGAGFGIIEWRREN